MSHGNVESRKLASLLQDRNITVKGIEFEINWI